MPRLAFIYQRLRLIRDSSVDLAMAAALPTADPRAATLITLSLLERHTPEGLLALVMHYHRLPKDAQGVMVHHVGDFSGALRKAGEYRDTPGPANMLEIIRLSHATRLAYLAVEEIRHGSPELRRDAAFCLLELARWVNPLDGVPPCDPLTSGFLVTSLQEALTVYRHHRQPVVLQAIVALMPRPMPAILKQLADRHHPANQGLRSLLAEADDRAVRRSLMSFLRLPSLADAAMSGIGRCAVSDAAAGATKPSPPAGTQQPTPADAAEPVSALADVLMQGHLLTIPHAHLALRRLTVDERFWPGDEALSHWPTQAHRALPAWAAAMPVEPRRRIDWLASLAIHDDAVTRVAALRRLIQINESAALSSQASAGQAISAFCDDTEPEVARLALRHLIRVDWSGLPSLLLRLVNSPHAVVRQIAGRMLAPLGFAKLWEAWPRLPEQQRLAAGRALIKLDTQFHRQLGEKLAAVPRDTRLRALAIIHELNQGSFFETPLLSLLRGQDVVVAASAAKALASADSASAIMALEKALDHADARVRANAVESLQSMNSARHVKKLVEMSHSDDNRPRANAIQSLLSMKTSDALTALVRMLSDTRPEHRISALWLVETMGLMPVARHVAELSISDHDRQVQQRAKRVIKLLIDALENPTRQTAKAG